MANSVALTIDVEDWYHIPSVCGSPFSVYKSTEDFYRDWKGKYDYLSEPTGRTLDILNEFGVKATFFVVASVIDHYPGLVESIVEKGHEIGCHGLDHSCKIDPVTKEPLVTQEEFESRTRAAKEKLEEIYGKKVIGYRAPNALVGGWMLKSLHKLGFKYDSSVSVNSFYNKTDSSLIGVGPNPYRLSLESLEPADDGGGLIEFPFAYLDVVKKIPCSGGPMLRFLGANVVHQGIRQSLKTGDALLYFHPIDLSTETFPSIGNNRPMYWLIKGKIVERRVRYLLNKLNDVPICPINQLVN